ncbi:MAG: fatty acid desaturase family protein [Myxococcales bacterium]|nr:fatty acid desaturase family protein [Myxococcales bacterium]
MNHSTVQPAFRVTTENQPATETSHPHDLVSSKIPERLTKQELQAFSRISPFQAAFGITVEWAGILTAILLAEWAATLWVTLPAIVWIGSRQHALLVIAHDAAHFRLLPNRTWNDWVGNVLLAWPMFISVQGFRHFHGAHHKYLAAEGDGNRELWGTHDKTGNVTKEWLYPKSTGALVGKILWRAAGFTGLFWMLRGIVGGFQFGMSPAAKAARLVWLGIAVWLFTITETWLGFVVYWAIPYCTWHIAVQYIRLICEHSNVPGRNEYSLTRTTQTTWFERLFFLPHHVGLHLEHHWYPSVPYYRLPQLHRHLMQRDSYAQNASISPSLWTSLRDVTRGADMPRDPT